MEGQWERLEKEIKRVNAERAALSNPEVTWDKEPELDPKTATERVYRDALTTEPNRAARRRSIRALKKAGMIHD